MNQAASSIFEQHLDPTSANYTPLSPLTFIERAASVYPEADRRYPRRRVSQLGAHL